MEAQHAKGKLTARERLDLLLDPDSFEELGMLVKHRSTNFDLDKQHYLGDGVVTGYGRIGGRLVYFFPRISPFWGVLWRKPMLKKICRVMDLAMQNGAPLIGLNDSGGARIQEGVVSLGGLCRYLLPQCAGQRSDSSIECNSGPLRWRSGLFAGFDGLHFHGGGIELHVRNRARTWSRP